MAEQESHITEAEIIQAQQWRIDKLKARVTLLEKVAAASRPVVATHRQVATMQGTQLEGPIHELALALEQTGPPEL